MSRPTFILFAVSSVLISVSTVRIIFAPMALVMPDMAHYLPTIPVPLFGHIVFGPLALLLMPLQFWQGLRNRRPNLHRAFGYGYVISVLIAAVSALALLPKFLGTSFSALGFLLLAFAWIGCTGLAVVSARRGNYEAHRIWMIRSAAMTFGAVTLRLQLPFLFAAGYSLPGAYGLLAWDSWVPNLILVQLWLNAKRRVVRRAV